MTLTFDPTHEIDLEQFIPEAYKDRSGNVLGKLVDLLEVVVNNSNNIDLDQNFAYEVENLTEYWDILRKDYKEKVRDLLDPYKITELMRVDDEQLTRILYLLSSMYASKGTETMFRLILRLAGMDAELIRWYQPEYLEWRPFVEKCKSLMVVKVGDTPITEEALDRLNQLMELLLDVCLVIPSWFFIKNLTDQVDLTETINTLFVNSGLYSKYSTCKLNLFNIYGQEEYYPYADFFVYDSIRYLTPTELIKYTCNTCSYIYGPVENNYIPFLELLPNWQCPTCGALKNDFTALEIDPTGNIESIKWILGSMLKKDWFNSLMALSSTFNDSLWVEYNRYKQFIGKAKPIVSTSYVYDIANHTFSDILTEQLLYLIDKIGEDKYESLTEVNLNVTPAAIDPYTYGKIGAPYLLHGYPSSKLHAIDHFYDPTCPHYHNFRWTHSGPTGVPERDDFHGQEPFNVHVKDPTIRYSDDSNPCFYHDSKFNRGERFDFVTDYKIRCEADVPCYKDGGAFSYPRHGMAILSDPDDFFHGYVNNQYDPTLITKALDLEQNSQTDDLVLYVKNILFDICMSFSSPEFKEFAEALSELSLLMKDSIYVSNLRNYATSVLTPVELIQFEDTIDYVQYLRSL